MAQKAVKKFFTGICASQAGILPHHLFLYLLWFLIGYGVSTKRKETESLITAPKQKCNKWIRVDLNLFKVLGILRNPCGHPRRNSSISTSILHQPQKYTNLALWRVINICKESLSVFSLWVSCLGMRIYV